MRTHSVKKADISGEWYVVDAEDRPLGRLATQVAGILKGKHRAEYSPHLDLGDHVVVVNAEKVYLSGRKRQQKTYWSYSGYPGGLRYRQLDEVMRKDPSRVVRHAVKGMLPSNRLGRRLLKKLKVYAGPAHPHSAQKPKALPVND
jgi:large subunit ribosomal protein L13